MPFSLKGIEIMLVYKIHLVRRFAPQPRTITLDLEGEPVMWMAMQTNRMWNAFYFKLNQPEEALLVLHLSYFKG